jgi:hypothetical protein
VRSCEFRSDWTDEWTDDYLRGTRRTLQSLVNERLQVGCAIYHGDGGVLDCVDQVRELAGT